LGGLTVIGYTRVSSAEQVTEGVSLDAQRARIEAWVEATDADLIEVIEDPAVSGSRPLAQRDGGARIAALLDQREPAVEAVVVTRLDRLGRNASETLGHLHRFANGKVGLVSILDRLDLSTPQGRAMAGVAAVFGQLERELIAQRTSEALARLRAQGRVFGAIPYGWVRSGNDLLPDTDEQRVRREIIELRDSRCSFREIAGWLNREGVPAKRGGRWSAMSVRSICLTAARDEELVADSAGAA
jgi:DNA invertase Pin-like site-specific DNA recombinase